MTEQTEREALEAQLLKAADAYDRVLEGAEGMSPGSAAISGAMVMTLHGHLFRAAANAIRAAIARAGE